MTIKGFFIHSPPDGCALRGRRGRCGWGRGRRLVPAVRSHDTRKVSDGRESTNPATDNIKRRPIVMVGSLLTHHPVVVSGVVVVARMVRVVVIAPSQLLSVA